MNMYKTFDFFFFFFKDTPTTEIYTSSHTLSLHDALPISVLSTQFSGRFAPVSPSISARATMPCRSEEHTSELQSRELISYAVFCLKKKKKINKIHKFTLENKNQKKKK